MSRKFTGDAPKEGERSISRKNPDKSPEGKRGRLDLKKMIVYSEILKPKFDE